MTSQPVSPLLTKTTATIIPFTFILSFNHRGCWGTTDDFTTSFPHWDSGQVLWTCTGRNKMPLPTPPVSPLTCENSSINTASLGGYLHGSKIRPNGRKGSMTNPTASGCTLPFSQPENVIPSHCQSSFVEQSESGLPLQTSQCCLTANLGSEGVK